MGAAPNTGDKRMVIGDWAVVHEDEGRYEGRYPYASHLGCSPLQKRPNATDSWLITEKPVCWYCGATVPDEIQALIILANNGV